jgi:hypothetical protein
LSSQKPLFISANVILTRMEVRSLPSNCGSAYVDIYLA